MTLQVSIASNLADVEKELKRLGHEGTRKAIVAAMNKTGAKALVFSRRGLAKRMGVAQKNIREGFRTRRATRIFLLFVIFIRGKRLNLIRFGARQLKRAGVSARAWGIRRRYPGTFIALRDRTATGGVVFKRVRGKTMRGRSKYAGTKHAEAIAPVFGPGLAREFDRPEFQALVIRKVEAEMPTEWERAIKLETDRMTRRINRARIKRYR